MMKSSSDVPSSQPVPALQHLKRAINQFLQMVLHIPSKKEFTRQEWIQLIKLKELLKSPYQDDDTEKEKMQAIIKSIQLSYDKGMKLAELFDFCKNIFTHDFYKAFSEYSSHGALTADDFVPMIISMISYDTHQLETICDQFALLDEVCICEGSPYFINEIGYYVSTMHACCKQKLQELKTALSPKNQEIQDGSKNAEDPKYKFIKACAELPNEKMPDNQEKNHDAVINAIKLTHTCYPEIVPHVSEELLLLSKRTDLDAIDIHFIKQNTDRYLSMNERIKFASDDKGYKHCLSAWTETAWNSIYNDFKAIVQENKNALLDTYTHLKKQNSMFWFPSWSPNKFKNKAKVDTLIDAMRTTCKMNAPVNTVMKNLINNIAQSYLSMREEWLKSDRCKLWLEKHPQLDKNQKERYYATYLSKELKAGNHYARILAYILYKLASIGALDVMNYKPSLAELNPMLPSKNIQDCMQYCEKEYVELSKLMNRVTAVTANLPSYAEFRHYAKHRELEIEKLAQLVTRLPRIDENTLKKASEQFKTEFSNLNKFAQHSAQTILYSVYPADVQLELKYKLDDFRKRFSVELSKFEQKETIIPEACRM